MPTGEAVTHTAKPEEDTTATTTNASPEVLSTADHIWPNKTVYYTFAQTLSKCKYIHVYR